MVYVEIIYNTKPFSDKGLDMWYTRMKIDSTAADVQPWIITYFLKEDNEIRIEDDVTEESYVLTKCEKSDNQICMQFLFPFGLIKDKFLK